MVTLVRNETSERDALLAYLEAQRGALRRAVLGLTEEQAAQRPSASELSLGGLVKHLARTEHGWIQTTLMGRPEEEKRGPENWADDFRLLEGETLAGTLAQYDAVARQTEKAVNGLPDLEVSVPLPEAPWFPAGMKVSARWILLTMIQETARHAGHADIVRESLDGKTAFELVAQERGKPF